MQRPVVRHLYSHVPNPSYPVVVNHLLSVCIGSGILSGLLRRISAVHRACGVPAGGLTWSVGLRQLLRLALRSMQQLPLPTPSLLPSLPSPPPRPLMLPPMPPRLLMLLLTLPSLPLLLLVPVCLSLD